MAGVDKDDLVVLVDTVLVHPVRVQDPEIATSATDTLLCCALKTALRLDVVHTLADRLSVGSTLGGLLLAVAAADTDTVDDVALLGLVAQAASLVRAGGTRGTVDDVQLAVLPRANIFVQIRR
jgi:hypothetical protein